MAQLAAEPVVNADDLARLGTYVFTSPKIDPYDPGAPPDTTVQVIVDKILVVDITADRPGVSPEIIRAYIHAAAKILTRPISDANQRQHYYVYARLLLPKAERFAPDYAPQIAEAMRALIPDIPPSLTQESAYANLLRTREQDLEEALRDEGRRDGGYLSLVFTLWHRGDFNQARPTAAKIKGICLTSWRSLWSAATCCRFVLRLHKKSGEQSDPQTKALTSQRTPRCGRKPKR